MKKLFSLLLALCLLGTMSLSALASDADQKVLDAVETAPPESGEQVLDAVATVAPESDEKALEAVEPAPPAAPLGTTDGSEKFSLKVALTVNDTDMDVDELKTVQSVLDFVKQLTLDITFAEAGDVILANVQLLSGEDELGTVELAFTGDALYAQGDMLPEGWVTIKYADLEELFAQDMGTQFSEMMEQQTAVMDALMVLGEQLFIAVSDWIETHPELVEERSLSEVPEGVDPVAAYVRLNITRDMYPTVYKNMDAALREMAAQGTLTDLDGSKISAAGYDASIIGGLMSEVLDEADDLEAEGVIDVLADEDGMPGFAVDFSVEDFNVFLRMLRQTAPSGAVDWNGVFSMEDDDQTGRVIATILGTSNDPAEDLRRYEGTIQGQMIELPAEREAGNFGVNGYISFPGGSAFPEEFFSAGLGFDAGFDGEKVHASFEMKGLQQSDADGIPETMSFDTTMTVGMTERNREMSAALDMGIAYESLTEGLEIPDFAAAPALDILNAPEEEQTVYGEKAQGMLMQFMFRLMAAMPPELQSEVMAQ